MKKPLIQFLTILLIIFSCGKKKYADIIIFGGTFYTVDSVNSKTDFMKLKLSELQCIAEENNINIKKEKGKKKTKTELSKEISDHFSKKNPSVI